MEKIKQLSILFIPYATICTGLYHIVYWSNFDLNGLEIISISNLIKSAILPLVIAANPLLGTVIGLLLFKEFLIRADVKEEERENEIKKMGIGSYIFSFFIFFAIVLLLFYYKKYQIIPFFISIVSAIFFEKYFLLFKKQFRVSLLMILFFIPSNIVYTAYKNATLIKDNIEFQYIIKDEIKYKYLGINDKYLICCDINNQKIEFFNLDLLGHYSLFKYKLQEKKFRKMLKILNIYN
jgi:hypothetical protein